MDALLRMRTGLYGTIAIRMQLEYYAVWASWRSGHKAIYDSAQVSNITYTLASNYGCHSFL